ncbi:MAG TPA: contractile injection system protein, VgrG/Pvc8 family [Lachnospiraceae bacterium]|nr:contractile injection system protein, VgrG/Pvc8 family [Lachnospiraceae bacterium]
MSEAITSGMIHISNYKILSLQKLKITACVNEHSSLYLKGILAEEKEGKPAKLDYQTIAVSVDIDQEEKTIFHGIVTEVKVKAVGKYQELQVKAKSFTYLMDIRKQKRSFQDKERSSHKLIRSIVKEYTDGSCIINYDDEPINRLWLQYEETDWDFLKRLLSTYHVGMFPYVQQSGVRFFVDIPQTRSKSIKVNEYKAVNQIERYESRNSKQSSDLQRKNYLTYSINSYEVLTLGEGVHFKEETYYCRSLTYELVHGLLKNSYELDNRNGQKPTPIYSSEINGLSIEGNVIDVNKTQVKVHLDIDQEQDKGNACWFPFSTVSASPDGSGWYFMPEVNDRVRVYFPTRNEAEAVAVSCVHTTGGNEEEKYIQNIYGNRVVFGKDSVTISANGAATLTLSKGGNVSISGGSISINASESITMRSEDTMNISAADSITMKCDQGGKIFLDNGGDVKLKGNKIKIN